MTDVLLTRLEKQVQHLTETVEHNIKIFQTDTVCVLVLQVNYELCILINMCAVLKPM